MPLPPDPVCQSFLLRCGLVVPETTTEPAVWRFELQEVSATLPRHRFSDLVQLQAFVAGRLMAVGGGHHHPPPETTQPPLNDF